MNAFEKDLGSSEEIYAKCTFNSVVILLKGVLWTLQGMFTEKLYGGKTWRLEEFPHLLGGAGWKDRYRLVCKNYTWLLRTMNLFITKAIYWLTIFVHFCIYFYCLVHIFFCGAIMQIPVLKHTGTDNLGHFQKVLTIMICTSFPLWHKFLATYSIWRAPTAKADCVLKRIFELILPLPFVPSSPTQRNLLPGDHVCWPYGAK